MAIKNTEGEILKAGCVVIDDNAKVLLMTTESRDVWAFPKGHAEYGEAMEEVALRETLEETGYEVKILEQLKDLTYINSNTGEQVRVAMFLAKPIRKIKDNTDEISEWQTITNAKDLVLENLRPYLDGISR